jgi:hypothetical protein|nr:MAG TPA: protein of unknown function (DUF4338) [Caudoviricetes sp.]
MGRCKEIVIKVIPPKIAIDFVKRHHYSGKVVNNSQLHFGAFLDGELHGVLQYGPSMDKRKVLRLVEGTEWNGFIELNRMAFDDYLPRNSESYCIGKTLRMIRKHAPHVKWVISFADGCQCGDGTIYRASNFVLTGITKNKTIIEFPSGDRMAALTFEKDPNSSLIRRQCESLGIPVKYRTRGEWLKLGAKYVEGFQLRYIYFLDPKARAKLTVPEIPFSEIDNVGAGMYKGERVRRSTRHEIKSEGQK